MSTNKPYETYYVPLSIMAVLCASYLFYPVSGGENQYLAMAKQFSDPDWIPNSFTLSEFPGSRLVFQYVFGWPLKWLSIESAALLFRILNYGMIAFPLYKISKQLNLKPLYFLLVLQVFLTGQSQLGGEWILGTFEPKTISYVFFMWAFWFWLQEKRYQMTISGVLACYFHIIVGGWFFIAVGLISLVQNQWKQLVKPALLAMVLVAPFIYYLVPVFSHPEILTDPTPDHIYAYTRLNNHLGIAKTWDYFIGHHLKGSMITLVLFVLSFAWQRKIPEPLKPWIRTGFGISLVYVVIALTDSFLLNQQASLGLKFYPFRLNSFSYFLVLVSFVYWIQTKTELHWRTVKWIILALVLGLGIGKAVDSQKRKTRSQEKYHPLINEWVKENTKSSDIFLLDIRDYNGIYYQNFSRLTHRENYSVYKFIPADKQKILEWDRRQDVLKRVLKLGSESKSLILNEKIDFVISERVLNLQLAVSAEGLNVYRVSNQH